MAAPERYITSTLPRRSHRTRLRRTQDFIRYGWSRVRVERQDLIVLGALLALLAALLFTRYSDRFFERMSGQRDPTMPPPSEISAAGQ